MIPLVEVAFLLVYAVLLSLVAPYLTTKNENYGELIPGALSLAVGSVLWSVLLWVGLSPDNGWIWAIVMLAMPFAYGYGAKLFGRFRLARKAEIKNF